jgi:Ser/Thr protein kinase RdoA (MazF antagonist)
VRKEVAERRDERAPAVRALTGPVDPAEAALAVARRLGVEAREAEVVETGRRVTLWEWWEPAGRDDTPEAAGRGLATCHRALTGVELQLRPWAKLEEARGRLPELAPADRAVLAPHLELPDGPLRPIHGDAHAGNVLPGPAWHDWEDAQLGWVEWDLGCLVATGRVLGMDFGHGETMLAAYDAPYDEGRLDWCVAARTAQVAVYGLLLGDAVPGLPERVAARLDWLSASA